MNPIISVDDFERAVYRRDHEKAGQLLLSLLNGLMTGSTGAFVRGQENARIGFDEELRVMTRITGAAIAFLADPKTTLNQGAYEAISTLGAMANSLIELSGYRSTEQLWRLLAEVDATGNFHFSENALRKALALAVPSSMPLPVVEGLRRVPKSVSAPAILALLSHHLVLTEAANANRQALLNMGDLLDGYMISDYLATMIGLPWMLCSYADIESKHDMKRHLNGVVKQWIARKSVSFAAPAAPRPTKPRVGIVMEYATANHAMLRCYGPAIRALSSRFTLVGVLNASTSDEPTRSMFDEIIDVKDGGRTYMAFFESMKNANLDVLYFPSVGMTAWGVWAANCRIAPLQIMSLGHPATSHSDCIDFVLAPEGINFSPDTFSEQIVMCDGIGSAFTMHADLPEKQASPQAEPDVIRIGVPAKLFKLDARFLSACKHIGERIGAPVEWHFFPNEYGALYHLARQRVEEALPGSTTFVYPSSDYVTYIRRLERCQVSLGAFCFGNTNGAIDSLCRGVPVVALDGPEIHQGSEQVLMRGAGQPEWTIASTVEDYVDAVVKLCTDHRIRSEVSAPLASGIRAFVVAESAKTGHIVDVFAWVHEHHEQLKAAGDKVIRPEIRRVAG